MKTELECAWCFIHDIVGALRSLKVSPSKGEGFLHTCFSILADEFSLDEIPSVFITRLHRELKLYTGMENPFREVRERLNELGMEIFKKLERELAHSDDRSFFRRAVIWSIAGNHMDIRTAGVGYEKSAQEMMDEMAKIVEEGLWVDDVDHLMEAVKGAYVLLIHDNVGEIAIDKLLIEALKRAGAVKVVSAVRSSPMTSDATVEDAVAVGLHDYADEVIIAAPDTLGVIPEEMTSHLKEEMKLCSLIITKGQANFYSFDEIKHNIEKNICFLLRTKCNVVSSKFSAESSSVNICMLWRPVR